MKRHSMERKISLRLFFMGSVGLILTAIVCLIVFYRVFSLQLWRSLEQTTQQIAVSCSKLENKEQLSDFALSSLRLTLIDPQGEVLYDSQTAVAENHLSRPEIQAALASGEGKSQRHSATVGYQTYYYAVRLDDGSVLRVAQDAATLRSIFVGALPAVLLGCIFILVLSIVLSCFLTRDLIKPIHRMVDHLDDIRDKVPYTELEPLADAIHSDQILRANNEKIRREFTANISHELKTPLTSISGYAELIEAGLAKPEDVPGFATRIHTEASRMIALVNDILALSHLDSLRDKEPSELEFTECDLAQVAQSCSARLRVNAQRAFVSVSVDAAPAIVLGNRSMLDDLCQNLCDNAIRYNRPGGKVRITTGHTASGTPFLQVQDDGIGIPQDAQARIFERFYRVDKSRSKATGGTGLGLAIVKHIALNHKAQLELKSQPGNGTCITVAFPPLPSENPK